MNPERPSPPLVPMLWTFLAGAAVGAIVVALTTPKSGPELRGDLKDLARRAKRKVGNLADEALGSLDELKLRAGLAPGESLRGRAESLDETRV